MMSSLITLRLVVDTCLEPLDGQVAEPLLTLAAGATAKPITRKKSANKRVTMRELYSENSQVDVLGLIPRFCFESERIREQRKLRAVGPL